jgi:hypothetical protein
MSYSVFQDSKGYRQHGVNALPRTAGDARFPPKRPYAGALKIALPERGLWALGGHGNAPLYSTVPYL